jgi:hypothetical protein
MGVGADADRLSPFAEVQVLVLVAQDRPFRPRWHLIRTHQRGHLGGPRELMAQGQQRDGSADHLPDLRSPESGTGDDDIGRNPVITVDHGTDAPAGGLDVGDRGPVPEFDSGGTGAFDDELGAFRRQRQAVTGGEQSAEDHVPVEHREQPSTFLGVDDVGFDTVGPVPASASVQVTEPILGGGDFEAADGQE